MISMLLSVLCSQWTLLVGIIVYIAYKWSTWNYDYFEKRNIRYEKPLPLFGNTISSVFQTEPLFIMFKRFHDKYKQHKYIGLYDMRDPMLFVMDPEIIKQVTVKNFDSFVNHKPFLDVSIEPMFGNSLFLLQDQKWKDMRATLSPAFTGSKMRLMFQLIDETCRNVNKYLKSQMKNNEPLEVNLRDFCQRFSSDVIATCAFGIDINSLYDKENEFFKMSQKLSQFSTLVMLKFFAAAYFPKLFEWFKIDVFDAKFMKYFRHLVLGAMNERHDKGIFRPDMINLLMDARKGVLKSQDVGRTEEDDGFATAQESHVGLKAVTRNWSDDEFVSQCFLFFIAGFESSSTLMIFCAYELTTNPEIQERLTDEIDEVCEKLAGKPLSYEILQKMKYMDMVISETLRKWPPNPALDRVCNKTCVIDDENGEQIELQPGLSVGISIVGLHHDPRYFPNPDKFDPERFNDENKHNIKPFSYLPFGSGPRNCIGSRFALIETKAIIFYLLSEFKFEPSANIKIPPVVKTGAFQPQLDFKTSIILTARNK